MGLPVFVFGENDMVTPWAPLPRRLTAFLRNQFRISTILFAGRAFILPYRAPMNMCFGSPISVKQTSDKGELESETARVHDAYKAEMRKIYEENKGRFGYEDRKLIMISDKAEQER